MCNTLLFPMSYFQRENVPIFPKCRAITGKEHCMTTNGSPHMNANQELDK